MIDLPKLRTKLRSAILCLEVHPDNTLGSEFEDRISDLEDIVEEIDTIILAENLNAEIMEKVKPEPSKPLHKDTDLGHFTGLILQSVIPICKDLPDHKLVILSAVGMAKDLIGQLDKEDGNG